MARSEYRDRDGVEVSLLDTLVAHADDGMTVFDLRAMVDADIDRIETALEELKADELIDVRRENGSVFIYPADRVVPDPDADPDDEPGLFDRIREIIGR